MPKIRIFLAICVSVFLFSGCGPKKTESDFEGQINGNIKKMSKEGKEIFRYDTFGSEAFWGDKLKLHEAIAGEKYGGVGPGLTPRQALDLGIKVDMDKVVAHVVRVLKEGKPTEFFDDPANTISLIRSDAVIGIKGFFKGDKLTGIGIQCSFCHSTVDDKLKHGIGNRLDGWPNRDLNVGAIVALAPGLNVVAERQGVDLPTLKKVLMAWGPGKYDAELLEDGKGFRPDGKSAATLLPAAFGLAGVNLHTYTGWGSVTYWNAYVANTQMHGSGTFFDPRMNDPERFPVAVKEGDWNMRNTPDHITSKLAALHFYQLSIPAPKPPKNSYDEKTAERGREIFEGKAKCSNCHVPPLFTEPGWSMHTGDEIGIDDFQASRSPDKKFYRTTPLKGLFTRVKGGFYHDGRFKDYGEVVEHYNSHFNLNLSKEEKLALIEYLKSL